MTGADTVRLSDDELISKSQQGDRQAFDDLMQQYYSLVYNVAFRMLGNADSASDATQTTVIRAYRALTQFRQDAAFSTWLYRIATNVCLDRLRQDERNAQSLTVMDSEGGQGLDELDVPDNHLDPAGIVERYERQTLVQEAIDTLHPEHRTVVVLFDINGLSYEEISEMLEVPLGTVKSRLNRARIALKERLMPHLELFR